MQKQSGANTVAVVETVQQRLEELKRAAAARHRDVRRQGPVAVHRAIDRRGELPPGHRRRAGGADDLLFIQDWRTTIIASLAIPASIVTTFAFMYWMGYTLNNMTMLG